MATVYLRKCITAVQSLQFYKPAGVARHSLVPALSIFRSGSSGALSKASSRLLQCLNEEIRLEKKVPDNLPAVGKFNIQIKGSLATLVQNYGQEKIQVQLDANSAIEVVQDEEDLEDGGEPLFVPTFTVTVSKPGTSLQFDCSFDEGGSYEEGIEWEFMHIDSVTVLPDDSSSSENIYSADAENLNEELYSALRDFLKERGINEKFATDIFRFYIAFEHKRYINDFLKPLKSFIQNN